MIPTLLAFMLPLQVLDPISTWDGTARSTVVTYRAHVPMRASAIDLPLARGKVLILVTPRRDCPTCMTAVLHFYPILKDGRGIEAGSTG